MSLRNMNAGVGDLLGESFKRRILRKFFAGAMRPAPVLEDPRGICCECFEVCTDWWVLFYFTHVDGLRWCKCPRCFSPTNETLIEGEIQIDGYGNEWTPALCSRGYLKPCFCCGPVNEAAQRRADKDFRRFG